MIRKLKKKLALIEFIKKKKLLLVGHLRIAFQLVIRSGNDGRVAARYLQRVASKAFLDVKEQFPAAFYLSVSGIINTAIVDIVVSVGRCDGACKPAVARRSGEVVVSNVSSAC